MRQDFDRTWGSLSIEILTGMKEWRLQHPRATLREIEVALDERLARMRARMLEDAAMASTAAEWEEADKSEHPVCPACGQEVKGGGVVSGRCLQTQGGQEITLKRRYGVCAHCGVRFFPPG